MKEIFLFFLKLGCLGFGGPLALISQMQKELVQDKKWLNEEEFARLFSLIKAMPGPIAFQLAVYLSFQRKGLLGALLAAFGLITPAALLMVVIAANYDSITHTPWMNSLMHGMQIGAFALILLAVKSLSLSFYRNFMFWIFLVAGLLLVFTTGVPEPLLIIGFGLISIFRKKVLLSIEPLSALGTLATLGWISLKAGTFIFGTGLAIIPILQRDFVDQLGWLTRSQFLDAVSFGQLTPGPVSVTVTFIGYKMAGFAGATVATVMIFLPGFLHMTTWFPRVVNWLSRQNWIGDFTLGVTAAVVATIISALVPMAQGWGQHQFYIVLALIGASLAYPVPGWAMVLLGGALGFYLI